MRTKILMITAMLAVMVALAGPAYAANFDLVGGNPIIELPPGGSIILDGQTTAIPAPYPVTIGLTKYVGFYPPAYTFAAGVACVTAGCTTTDIDVNILKPSYPVGGQNHLETGVVKITMSLTPADAPGTMYLVAVNAGGFVGVQLASRPVQSAIPEFPTVALPVGAALGLMFLFSRKNKKE